MRCELVPFPDNLMRFNEFSRLLKAEFPDVYEWVYNSKNTAQGYADAPKEGGLYGRLELVTGIEKEAIPKFQSKRCFNCVMDYIRNNIDMVEARIGIHKL